MTHKATLAIALTATLALPMSAQAFTAENRVDVMPRSGATFQVEEDLRYGAVGQWCAAADYAQRALNAGWTQRIYVRGQGNERRSVVFGLKPAGAAANTVRSPKASLRTPGSNMSVQRAFAFCINQRLPDNISR